MENQPRLGEQQDFIVETPQIIEEKLARGSKDTSTRKYEKLKFLGKGGFAKCYELRSLETKKVYAAKIFEKRNLPDARSRRKLVNEIKLHKKLHHPNIVNFEHFFEDKEAVYILLEICTNQTLNDLLKRRKRLTEIEVVCLSTQLIRALKYIHQHNIIHRDLKLGNCFLNSNLEVKLGDFGLAAKLEYEGQRRKTVCGTPNYIAPEVLKKENGHSFEVDVWSLGVMIYTMLYGKPPFESSDPKLTYSRIKANNYSFPENIPVHPLANDLLSKIFVLNPEKRIKLDEILSHGFFNLFPKVPVTLPSSVLACPPTKDYLAEFIDPLTFDLDKFSTNLKIPLEELKKKRNSTLDKRMEENNDTAEDNLKGNLGNLQGSVFHRKSESYNTFASGFDINNEKLMERLAPSLNALKADRKEGSDGRTYFTSSSLEEKQLLKRFETLKLTSTEVSKLKQDQRNLSMVLSGLGLGFETTVVKYHDYTEKFGVVYILSNNTMGIVFTDNSNLVKNLSKNTEAPFTYIDKDGYVSATFNEAKLKKYAAGNGPKEMTKKCDIMRSVLNKFSAALKGNFNSFSANFLTDKRGEKIAEMLNKQVIYVKNQMKTGSTIMFRLSNKLAQVSFGDKSDVVFSTETNDVMYRKNNEEPEISSIHSFFASEDLDLIKKIKTSKTLFFNFVKAQKTKKR